MTAQSNDEGFILLYGSQTGQVSIGSLGFITASAAESGRERESADEREEKREERTEKRKTALFVF
jgi:hypothetical protein